MEIDPENPGELRSLLGMTNYCTEEVKPPVTDLKDLITESNSDETLSIVRDALTYGKWPTTNTDPDVKLHSDIKDELTITQNGIILRSHRICVPKIFKRK